MTRSMVLRSPVLVPAGKRAARPAKKKMAAVRFYYARGITVERKCLLAWWWYLVKQICLLFFFCYPIYLGPDPINPFPTALRNHAGSSPCIHLKMARCVVLKMKRTPPSGGLWKLQDDDVSSAKNLSGGG